MMMGKGRRNPNPSEISPEETRAVMIETMTAEFQNAHQGGVSAADAVKKIKESSVFWKRQLEETGLSSEEAAAKVNELAESSPAFLRLKELHRLETERDQKEIDEEKANPIKRVERGLSLLNQSRAGEGDDGKWVPGGYFNDRDLRIHYGSWVIAAREQLTQEGKNPDGAESLVDELIIDKMTDGYQRTREEARAILDKDKELYHF